MIKYNLRRLSENDLERVLQWRNKKHIRMNMHNDNIISFDEHSNWYRKICNDPRNIYLVFELFGVPVGLVNFTNIDNINNKCYWGFYLGEESLPKGTGLVMGVLGLDYCFEILNIRKVIGEVYTFNEISVKFHEKLGFEKEGILREHTIKKGNYVDIVIFALFRDRWNEKRLSFKDRITRVI